MSKAKDRERAEREGLFRNDNESPKLILCPFPDCRKPFTPEDGKPNVCNEHRKLIADVLFILDNTTSVQKHDEEPKLFVPKPGMSNQAIKQAAEAAKGGQNP